VVLIVIFGVSKVSDRGTFKAKSLRKSGLKALLRRKAPDMAWQWVGECWVDVARIVHQSKLPYLGVGQNLLLSILMGWTSIYQLFWGSLGARVLTNSHFFSTKHRGFHHHLSGIQWTNPDFYGWIMTDDLAPWITGMMGIGLESSHIFSQTK